MVRWCLLGLPLLLANCASVIEGTSQVITVNSIPPGATCRLDRDGAQLGTVDATPGSVTVKPKTAQDILVTCEKPGFQAAAYLDKSDTAAATFGNILAGGVIGAIVDRSNGASYKYESTVSLTLAPAAPPGRPLPAGVPQS